MIQINVRYLPGVLNVIPNLRFDDEAHAHTVVAVIKI